MSQLAYGLLTGILFGFLLQRARVIRYDKQLGALLLQDMTVVKFMFSSIIVAMAGVYLLHDLGLVKLSLKPTILGGVIIGGLLFGIGWGLLGYCPGTAVGAISEGRLDAFWGGILGMLVGAGIFAEAYTFLKDNLLRWGDLGKLSIPKVIGINHWVIIAILWVLMILVFIGLEKKKV